MASRCEDGTVTGDFLDELPNFHIDTFSELEEHSGRFAEVSESDVEKFIEGEDNANKRRVESATKATQATWTRKQTKSHNGSYGRRNGDSF